ncbi:lipoprotein [Mesoplasma lactucae]|uniref:Uncharacterized protein n=1 Tax=Mesoplasma lactucae ATCC 49193 TaxID=81460 RepID=A0A291ISD9_9MOLU|nr:lipoprotein [Mesoplasma lactucae]ATG97673.1 hypothetical protein CP520_02955 [Mesoplasma lactucae ATCC 49193]ATZ19862.1 hypothetical protein MLACT_v1c00370 [Mesoplasma lactucae ATCC 49193]MCL8216725.1 hypothetical protein [Mesoplasma lactucae ATCC 49193]
MRKLLALLSAVAITSVSATSVVSCGVKTEPISVTIDGKNIGDNNYTVKGSGNGASYSAKDLAASIDGLNNSYQYKTGSGKKDFDTVNFAMGFNKLNDMLFRVMANDTRLITKPQDNYAQLRNTRDVFLGRMLNNDGKNDPTARVSNDDKKGKNGGFYTPSVDGGRIGSLEKNTKDYYDQFNATYINSIQGLHFLEESIKSEPDLFTGYAGTNAMVDNMSQAGIFSDKDSDASKYYNQVSKATRYSMFTNVSYKSLQGDSIFQEYNTKSALMTFNKKTGVVTGTNSTYKPWEENNPVKPDKQADAVKEKNKNPINNRPLTDPFGRLVLAPDEKDQENFNKITKGQLDAKQLGTTDGGVGENEQMVDTISNGNAEINYLTKKDGDHYNFAYNSQSFYTVKVAPIEVTYTFETNHNNGHAGEVNSKYNVSFTLNNLMQVYRPYVVAKGNDNPDNKDNPETDYNVTWLFAGYKFLNPDMTKETYDLSGKDRLMTVENNNDAGSTYLNNVRFELNHQLRDMKTTAWKIEDVTPKQEQK